MAEKAQLAAKTSVVKKDNSVIHTRKTDHHQSIRSPAERILFLQKTAGNQAVQRLLRSEMSKEKPTAGQQEDTREKKALTTTPTAAVSTSAPEMETAKPAAITKTKALVTPVPVRKEKVEKPAPPPKAPAIEVPALEAAAATPGTMEGTTDEVMKNFTESRASEMAATYPVLGEKLGRGFNTEREAATKNIPPIQVRTGGVDTLPESASPPPGPVPPATISKGTTEPEPRPQKAEPHRDLAPQPKNEELAKDAESPESARNVIGSITTHDPGLDTSAGERPIIETSGSANPQRAARQRAEGATQVQQQQSAIAEKIKSHPGAEQIQPVRVDEQAKITISEASETIKTAASDEMAGYAAMSIPENVRQAADAKMAPVLKQSMAGPRAEMNKAAARRDKDKQAAVENTQQQAAELSQQAQLDQAAIVQRSRQDVSQKQKRGLQESRLQMQAFNTETSVRQTRTSLEVSQRIESDQKKADEHLSAAEVKAEAERQKVEREAAARKQELESQSKEKSWWEKAVSAIKSAVSAITKAIDTIFNAVRKAIKTIIDTARKFVVDLIEAGRKWVASTLEAFGNWLKDKVTAYLKEFPALAARINKAIDRTVKAATRMVNAVAGKLKAGVNALAKALGKAIDAVLSTFQGALKGVVAIAGAVLTGDFAAAAKMVFLAAAQVLGIAAEKFMGILNKAGSAVTMIFKDPIGFFKNLLAALKKGFMQFTANIMKHLIGGLMGWLFGALAKAGIQVPTEFSLKAIFGLVMEILGLTYARIRAKAVKLIGEKNVEYIEKVWKFISMLITEGPAGLWEHIKEYLGNLKDTIINAVKGWVVTKIVKAAITKLLSMFNPVGAIVQAVLGIYNTVMFFIERINQIITLVEAVVNSIYKIATGAIGDAANWVENAMARTVPVIISFLARLIGLGGISKKISSIIKGVQERVDKAIDKVIAKVASKFRKTGKPSKPDKKEEAKPDLGIAKNTVKDALHTQLPKGARQVADVNKVLAGVVPKVRPTLTNLKAEEVLPGKPKKEGTIGFKVKAKAGKGGDVLIDAVRYSKEGTALSREERWKMGVEGVKKAVAKLIKREVSEKTIKAQFPKWKSEFGFKALSLNTKEMPWIIEGEMSPTKPVAPVELEALYNTPAAFKTPEEKEAAKTNDDDLLDIPHSGYAKGWAGKIAKVTEVHKMQMNKTKLGPMGPHVVYENRKKKPIAGLIGGRGVFKDYNKQWRREETIPQIHHIASNKGTTSRTNFSMHPAFQPSHATDIESDENKIELYGHAGNHSDEYHDQVRKYLDEAVGRAGGKDSPNKQTEVIKALEILRDEIISGNLKPYKNKDVWV